MVYFIFLFSIEYGICVFNGFLMKLSEFVGSVWIFCRHFVVDVVFEVQGQFYELIIVIEYFFVGISKLEVFLVGEYCFF